MNPTPSSSSRGIPRRRFILSSGGLLLASALGSASRTSAASAARVAGANSKIRIGLIGCGGRGLTAHLPGIQAHAQAANVEIAAVCDAWRIAREAAVEKVRSAFGRPPTAYASYEELLAAPDIDAVMIATCDHQHTTHLEAAARAGRHIYVEKPLATEMDKLVRAVDAVKAAGTVVQVGTQLRSMPGIVGARDLTASGALGKISRIEEARNAAKPYWYKHLHDVRAEDVDWKAFLLDRPARPFNAAQYSAWYGYFEFSQGAVAQWGAHFLDTIHFITGASIPHSCVCAGGTFVWKDGPGFTAPDCVQATWIYPEGFLVTSSNNFGSADGTGRRIYGTQGTIDLRNFGSPTFAETAADKHARKIDPVPRPDHFLDWLQAMRESRQPHAPIEAGYAHAVAVLMATRAYETGRRITYDPASRALIST